MGEIAPVWDVIVVGAGIAGAATALGLKRAMGRTSRVMLCDPALAPGSNHPARGSFRALAIAPDVQAFLDRLRIWEKIEAEAQPISGMTITDARPGLLPNQVYLNFDGTADGKPLAHLVFADDLRRTLVEACAAEDVVCEAGEVADLRDVAWTAALVLKNGREHRARLVAAADGAQSRLRHASRIQVYETDYPQSAIVATLSHSVSHGGRATQHFFPGGPIALLPLRDAGGGERRTSLVWTDASHTAADLASLPPQLFCEALQGRIGHALGSLVLEDRPQAFPLRLQIAKRLVGRRLALLGDAARVIHPLAGQGLNLGLRDAESLTRHAVAALGLGLDPGSHGVLDAYQTDRRAASAVMAAGTDLLDRLFSTDAMPIRAMRDFGLGMVDRSAWLKRGFTRLASGDDQDRAPSSEAPSVRSP